MDLEEKYNTKEVIKYSLVYKTLNKKTLVRLIPDFDGYNNDEGIKCLGIKNSGVGFNLDQEKNINIIKQIAELENDVVNMLRNMGYKLDKGCISKYNVDGQEKLSIWGNLVMDKKRNKIYSKIYDIDRKPIDIEQIDNSIIARPCFTFQIVYSKTKDTNVLRASIDEICVVNKVSKGYKMIPKH